MEFYSTAVLQRAPEAPSSAAKPDARTPRTGRWIPNVRQLATLCCAFAALACQYDSDDRCEVGQHAEGDFCVCEEGMVPEGLGCVACDENSTARNDVCACDEGFMRAGVDGPCVEAETGLGETCDPSAEPTACTEAFPICQVALGGDSYCTQGECSSDDDCPGLYTCDSRSASSHCARPATGVGDPCENHADCAGKDASYCVTLGGGGCAIADCKMPDEGCPGGYVCCDLTSVGLPFLCTTASQCQLL